MPPQKELMRTFTARKSFVFQNALSVVIFAKYAVNGSNPIIWGTIDQTARALYRMIAGLRKRAYMTEDDAIRQA